MKSGLAENEIRLKGGQFTSSKGPEIGPLAEVNRPHQDEIRPGRIIFWPPIPYTHLCLGISNWEGQVEREIRSWDLLEIVRDANVVKGAERHVLFALCMRANTKKNFTCFPSYAQIVEDSSVGLSQVKVAVRELAKAGWIRRQIRPNTSNLFFIDVPALKAAAEERRLTLRKGQLEETDDPCNVNGLCHDGGTNELDNTDGLESEPDWPEIPARVGDCTEVSHLVTMLRQMWGDHATFKDPRGVEFLTSDMARCVELAGSPFRCAHVLHFVYEDVTIYQSITKSQKLGLYLKHCFPTWLTTYGDRLVGMDYVGQEEES
jgi:hypothetical protein